MDIDIQTVRDDMERLFGSKPPISGNASFTRDDAMKIDTPHPLYARFIAHRLLILWAEMSQRKYKIISCGPFMHDDKLLYAIEYEWNNDDAHTHINFYDVSASGELKQPSQPGNERVTPKVDVRKLILSAIGEDYPIKSGFGLDVIDPIILTEKHHLMAVHLEFSIMNRLRQIFGYWEVKDRLQFHDGKGIDGQVLTYLDIYGEERTCTLYFDFSVGWANAGKMMEEVHTPEELAAIEQAAPEAAKHRVPYFLEAAYLALNTDDHIDEKHLEEALFISKKEATIILDRLDEVGLLDKGSRNILPYGPLGYVNPIETS